MNRFAILLKREYWENRGGFLWAPIWTAIVMLSLIFIGACVAMWHASGRFNGDVQVGVSLKKLIMKIPPEEFHKIAFGYEAGMGGLWMLVQVVLFFVLFFYLIGALYDERKDRSILFWKSLPVSDFETVMAKVVTATLVAPALAFAATVALHVGFLAILSVFVAVNGVNPMDVVWGPAEPLSMWARMLATIPLTALWGLPTVGWLLLCSAFAKSRPFLWAVALPIAVGIANGVFSVMQTLSVPSSWYWGHVVSRILVGIFPGGWLFSDSFRQRLEIFGDGNLNAAVDWAAMGNALLDLEMWIGVAAGVAMIAAAIHFRRKRELAD
jgi:ABC-2 type transport system permease protein